MVSTGLLHFFHQCRSTAMAHLLGQKSPQTTSKTPADIPSAQTNTCTSEWLNITLKSIHSTNSFHWLQGSTLPSCDCSAWVVGRHREDQRNNKWDHDHERVLACLAGLSVRNGKIRWTNSPQKMKRAIRDKKNYPDFTSAWQTILRENLKTKLH